MGKVVKPFLGLFFVLITLAYATPAPEAVEDGADPASNPVIIDFFFEPGCEECGRVKDEVFPELELLYEGFYELNHLDVGLEENFLKLARFQERFGVSENEPVSIVLDGRHILNGYGEIKEGLIPLMDRLVAEHMDAPAYIPVEEESVTAEDNKSVLVRRIKGFTTAGVIAAGLVDGINPCAISTLVFFISLLSVLKVSGGSLLAVGVAFCLSSFMTYLAIGFGLLRTLRLLSGFSYLQLAVNITMIFLLGVFAYLSFRDAYRFKKSGDASDVTLQIPHRVKLRIHRIMRGGLERGSLIFGGLFIGAAVTALESICTGQVYLPTLAMVVKSGQTDFRGFLYLVLYNLMFMVPIVTVFILVLKGLKTSRLLEWSRRNVVSSKMLLGFFFLAMAALLVFL